MAISFKKFLAYLFSHTLLLIGSTANCQVDSISTNNQKFEERLVSEFAKKYLPNDYFKDFDWENIKKVNAVDSILGWVVKPFIKSDTMIAAIFIRAEGNIPVDMVDNRITTKIHGIAQNPLFSLRNEISKGRISSLTLVQYSFVNKTNRVSLFPGDKKVFRKEEYDQVKKVDPAKAVEMLPDMLIYGGGNPPGKKLFIKLATFLPGSFSENYIPIENL